MVLSVDFLNVGRPYSGFRSIEAAPDFPVSLDSGYALAALRQPAPQSCVGVLRCTPVYAVGDTALEAGVKHAQFPVRNYGHHPRQARISCPPVARADPWRRCISASSVMPSASSRMLVFDSRTRVGSGITGLISWSSLAFLPFTSPGFSAAWRPHTTAPKRVTPHSGSGHRLVLDPRSASSGNEVTRQKGPLKRSRR